jgi:signal transduction histidine kinase/ActR/RegA family two-component response regulator
MNVTSGEMARQRAPASRVFVFASIVSAVAVAGVGLASLFTSSAGYMPHGHCYLWNTRLVALHVTADTLIGISYTAIALTLAYLVYRARASLPFHWMALAFGTFIIACGATHWMEVWTLWQPDYWLSGNVKLITAAASLATAIALPPLVPEALRLLDADRVAEARRRELEDRAELIAAADTARHEAESANRAKDQFLAVVSHELRTPLSPILLWSRMLQTDPAPDRLRQGLVVIERAARAQTQLIDDLLDVSRIAAGKVRLDVQPVELIPIVDAALEAVRPAADAKQIRLQTTLDPNAGPVSGDPDRLRQVLWNLLSNAIKFTPKGGRVHVGLARVNSHVELSVSDTGIGLDPDSRAHLFERFWQGEQGLDRRHGGVGLGLTIVRHLVELHGGRVEAFSEGVGQGCVFRISLPILVAAGAFTGAAREHPTRSALAGTLELAQLDGDRILVVDDQHDTAATVAALLAGCGAEVRTAASVADALALLETWTPDLVISDIGMPGEDGYAFIAQLRQRPAHRGGAVPAIALTAYARVEDRVRVLAGGFQMHVPKPVDPAELTAVVASLLHPVGALHSG